MTFEEFFRDWEDYKLVLKDGREVVFKNCFAMRFKIQNCDESLLFDTGGQQGATAYILKCDTNNRCFIKTNWSLSEDDPAAWEEWGTLVRI